MYEHSSDLYDKIYRSFKDYSAEAELVKGVIRQLAPTAKTILDVACGTGEHASFLKQDFTIDGLDINPAFVEISRTKNPECRFYVADMVDFDLGCRYDVVMCLFSSIGYVKTLQKLSRTLAAFKRHTESDGLIVVEPWFTPDVWCVGRPAMVTVDLPELKVCRMNIAEREGALSKFTFHYLVGDSFGVRHFTEMHELGLFTVEEMLACFREVGLAATYDEKGIFGRGLYTARLA